MKWTETRSENYRPRSTAATTSRTSRWRRRRTARSSACGRRCGPTWAPTSRRPRPAIPTILHGLMLSGAYDIKNIHEDVFGVFTNTTPTDAYRGAGRPEATFMVERLVDLVARKLEDGPGRRPQEELHPGLHRSRSPSRPASPTTRATTSGRSTRRSRCSTTRASATSRPTGARRASTSASGCAPTPRSAASGPRRSPARSASAAGSTRAAIVRVYPSGKVDVLHRHLAARPGRGDHLRPDRGRRARGAARGRRDRAMATPSARPWAGAPTAAARRGRRRRR